MELYEIVLWVYLSVIIGFIAMVGAATWRQLLREAKDAGLVAEREPPLSEERSPRDASPASARAQAAGSRRYPPA
jgi:hypothetical protein